MSGPSAIAVLAALAFVLGLVSLLSWVLGRVRHVRTGQAPNQQIEVLARAGVAPRQGVATLRVGGQRLLVSYGEGGVRYLTDLEDTDDSECSTAVEAESTPPAEMNSLKSSARRRLALAAIDLGGLARVSSRVRTWMLLAGLLFGLGAAAPVSAQAVSGGIDPTATQMTQGPQLQVGPPVSIMIGSSEEDGLSVSGPVGTVLFIGAMTLIPTLLLLTTSFTRIFIVLHLLKQALGTQAAPPAHLLAAMSVMLTGFVMAPTFDQVNQQAVEPWMNGEVDEMQMLESASLPLRDFMLGVTRDQDLEAFLAMRDEPLPETVDDIPFVVLTSAFVTSELTSAFQMGFALFLPFVVIDVVVASVLMSMGMFMLPPVMVSLPFKLLLFVLVDGWSLILGSLVQSF